MATMTPGPWDVQRVMGWCAIFAGTNGHRHIVANVGSSNDPEATVEANARLIAAAPEMLEVLRTVVLLMADNGSPIVSEARALLARIEGDGDAR